MRGLNVYCCPSCGHYGFFQLSANAVCPRCSISMTTLPISYQTFMDLDYPQRQILISEHMLNAAVALDSSNSAHLHVSPPFNQPNCAENHTEKGVPMAACTAIQLPNGSHPYEESNHSTLATLSVAAEKAEQNESIASSMHSSDAPSNTDDTTESLSNDSETDSSSEVSDKEELYQEIKTLREKNEQLEQTVSWMHDLIWDLTRRLHIT